VISVKESIHCLQKVMVSDSTPHLFVETLHQDDERREVVGKVTHRKEKSVMSSLEGKVAVVTGGNSGIGLATAKAFHANGARVVIAGRDRETLEEVARELGHNVLVVPADVTKLSEIDQLMARAYETFGKLDILFVNAGIYKGAPLEEVDEAAFDEMLHANLKGAYFTVQKALPFFNEPASIIFNGSVNALTGIANSSLYTANKGAVHALARALAAELIGRGIRVNTITIGPTASRLLARSGTSQAILDAQDVARISRSPVKRLGRPEEVANVALFLASDDASFVVGSEIAADGGWLLNII
jgi:NAD(P)-dependent dehydrogenase (short-subunit alcohol dehydrogenase family)